MTTAALRRARGLHLLVYYNVNKIFRKFSLTEKRFILFHGWWGASACLLLSIVSKLWLHRAAWQSAHDEKKWLNSWQTGNWEKEMGWGVTGDMIYLQIFHYVQLLCYLWSLTMDESIHEIRAHITSPGHSPLYIATFSLQTLEDMPDLRDRSDITTPNARC